MVKLLSNGVDVHFFEELLYDVSSLKHIAELKREKYSMVMKNYHGGFQKNTDSYQKYIIYEDFLPH